jgi:hypothetical protein
VLDPLDLPARRVTTWTATAHEAVGTLRTKREATPEGFHGEVQAATGADRVILTDG